MKQLSSSNSIMNGHPDSGERSIRTPRSLVCVVVTTHNYAHFLGECLDSIFQQTVTPDEIVVVDDASRDQPSLVCEHFEGVRYLRVEYGCPLRARKAGLEATSAPLILFVDADNRIPPEFIESALREMTDRNTAGAYADYQLFGSRTGRTHFPEFSREHIFCENFIDACCLLRRDALELVWDVWSVEYGVMPEDYLLVQALVREGWNFRKHSAVFEYRWHASQMTQTLAPVRAKVGYARTHGLDRQPLTLFVPLSGRDWAWDEQSQFLTRQTFPKHQLRLILCDTSQDAQFTAKVRAWLSDCDYADVRHFTFSASRPGLADESRYGLQTEREVNLAVCRIYNRLRAALDTEFCCILEDDIIPPDDMLGRLLAHFDRDVACVSAPYLSRFNNLPVVWDQDAVPNGGTPPLLPGTGVKQVRGTGFGCLLIRSQFLKQHVFSLTHGERYYDPYFFRMLGDQWKRLCDWSCWCRHLSKPVVQGAPRRIGDADREPSPPLVRLIIAVEGHCVTWPQMQAFLEQQTWPRSFVQLVLLNLSDDARFARRICRWIAEQHYRDVRLVQASDCSTEFRRRQETSLTFSEVFPDVDPQGNAEWTLWLSDEVAVPNDLISSLIGEFADGVDSLVVPTTALRTIRQQYPVRPPDTPPSNGEMTRARRPAERGQRSPFPGTNGKHKAPSVASSVVCRPIVKEPVPLMLEEHCPESWASLDLTVFRENRPSRAETCQWIAESLQSRQPIAIVSMGDGDIAWWCYDTLRARPDINRDWLERLALTSGLHPSDLSELWEPFDQACRTIPDWPVIEGWDVAERFNVAAFQAQGIRIERDRFEYHGLKKAKRSANAVYVLHSHGYWWPMLAGRRLAVVTSRAAELASLLINQDFVTSHAGGPITWTVGAAVSCPDVDVPKRSHWQGIVKELQSSDWVLLLCAAGGLSTVLCHQALEQGRQSLDLGAFAQQLLGWRNSPS